MHIKKVKVNKESHGIDGMKVDELLQHLKEHGQELRQSLKEGRYKQPVRRVEIPKPDGGIRKVSIVLCEEVKDIQLKEKDIEVSGVKRIETYKLQNIEELLGSLSTKTQITDIIIQL
ncbi:hypothetical protein CLTEP_03880 [Clostridium tepidiprofundi DSM 19306]|uniref:Uncharacterized protein n=1 Tax=Clostridium tepidiprofundi DSM 19306 TaxID=1121338 RepID=A0A151B7Y5_9CLOT|nr:hypothetical protein [Clostridium tepidiprofundi]KYH35994.1 hypothetical protein CLTEP_03880 [Clostridium tepidiprofundi DSM 19306]